MAEISKNLKNDLKEKDVSEIVVNDCGPELDPEEPLNEAEVSELEQIIRNKDSIPSLDDALEKIKSKEPAPSESEERHSSTNKTQTLKRKVGHGMICDDPEPAADPELDVSINDAIEEMAKGAPIGDPVWVSEALSPPDPHKVMVDFKKHPEILKKVKALSKRDFRKVSNQILYILDRAFDEDIDALKLLREKIS